MLKDKNRKIVYFGWLKLMELENTSIYRQRDTTIAAYCLHSHQLHLAYCYVKEALNDFHERKPINSAHTELSQMKYLYSFLVTV